MQPWNETAVDGRGSAYLDNIVFDFRCGEFRPGLTALAIPDGRGQPGSASRTDGRDAGPA